MRIFLSAGEASGDAYAAALVRELRVRSQPRLREIFHFEFEAWRREFPQETLERLEDFGFIDVLAEQYPSDPSEVEQFAFDNIDPDLLQEFVLKIQGVGGPRLATEVERLTADSSRWGAISIAQSLAVAPRALVGYLKARRMLRRGYPGLFIPIDFGFFNIRLAAIAKKRGWKVLYFVPPGSWRRDKQGRDLPQITDAIVTPFPWSAEILKGMGANVYFFGHPIKQLIGSVKRAPSPEGVATVAVLPGSRSHEVERNLPMIAQAVGGASPLRVQLEFALAPTVDIEVVKTAWKSLAPGREDLFTEGDVYGVLSRARAAVVCSGTATLEAALVGCPMVVVYRVTKAMAREAKLIGFKMPEFISLPNICLQRAVVPELVGLDIASDVIRSALEPLLSETSERAAQLAAFDEIDALLGPSDAITRTAELALSLITFPG